MSKRIIISALLWTSLKHLKLNHIQTPAEATWVPWALQRWYPHPANPGAADWAAPDAVNLWCGGNTWKIWWISVEPKILSQKIWAIFWKKYKKKWKWEHFLVECKKQLLKKKRQSDVGASRKVRLELWSFALQLGVLIRGPNQNSLRTMYSNKIKKWDWMEMG